MSRSPYARNRMRQGNRAGMVSERDFPAERTVTPTVTIDATTTTLSLHPFNVQLFPSLSSNGLSPSTSVLYSFKNNGSFCGKQFFFFKNSARLGPYAFALPISLLPARCRPRPTRHNFFSHYQRMVLRRSQSGFMKTPSGAITPTHLLLTSRSPKTA
jgi:hypothetical protein